MHSKIESAEDRIKRFKHAKAALDPARSSLQDVYDYVAPEKVNFNHVKNNSSESLTSEIWDSTALRGVKSWANNVQSTLMPPFQKWYELAPGNIFEYAKKNQQLSDTEYQNIRLKLQNDTDILFRNLNQSSVYRAVNESFKDLVVSTGVIAINELSGHIPFSFQSIPISEIYFEEGADGTLANFWREIKISGRMIMEKWGNKNLKLPQNLQDKIKQSPDEDIELIEACIEYKDEPEDKRYYYYIQDPQSKQDIYTDPRNYPAFIGFRMDKVPGNILGYGICQALYPYIRMLNLLRFYYIKAYKFITFPAFMATHSGALNPYTAIIEPGSIIPVAPDFATSPPIMALDTKVNLQEAAEAIQTIRADINEALFVNPLGDVATTKDRTANEMQLRNQNWVRQNATGIGRLANEFIRPLIKACLTILRSRGLIKDIRTTSGSFRTTDDNSVWIDYKSPMIGIQDEDDAQKLVQYMQTLTGFFGAPALPGVMNIAKIPVYLAEKLNIDGDLIRDEDQIQQIFQQLSQQYQTQQAEAQKAQELSQEKSPGQGSSQPMPMTNLGLQ